MKTILLLRHAKSDWSIPSLADIDRPLAQRGIKDAPVMGNALSRAGLFPDMIVSSPAKRAAETAELAAAVLEYDRPIEIVPNLYPGSPGEILHVLKQLPLHVQIVMIVGHNPALEETVSALLCTGTHGTVRVRIPTAALLCLKAEIAGWSELEGGVCVLAWMVTPKLLKSLKGK